MNRYVALLRGINVGGRTVKMDALRRHLEPLGFANVATVIASGNVLFDAAERDTAALEEKIETHLRRALGYDVATMVRSIPELADVAAFEAFPAEDLADPAAVLYVTFCKSAPGPEIEARIEPLRTGGTGVVVRGREVYWLRRERSMRTVEVMAKLEKALRVPATTRNITTVRKLAAK